MPELLCRPLSENFGIEIKNVNLRDVSEDHFFPEIREAFETHSVLLFREQNVNSVHHKRLAELFGPIEDREADERMPEEEFEIFKVSNITETGSLSVVGDEQSLDLIANQLWHTDSTFLPIPALVNILVADVVPAAGGDTELASTRAAWRDFSDELKSKLRKAVFWHEVSHSRAKISKELAQLPQFTKWPAQRWKAVWQNPKNGEEALYIASHVHKINGVNCTDVDKFVEELVTFCTQPKYVYRHEWRHGDVLIWDERATIHRGRPWPIDQPRSLFSICSSAQDIDGLDNMRVSSDGKK
jgi:alpha-ketoglutarate-dependent 2,4-dichlorophenoxyacetate dioxygenase